MNKTELTDKLADKTGMTKADSKRAIDALFSTAPREGIIATAVSKGDRVQITGFGTFERRNRKKRVGRNPQTGAALTIPAAKYPAFMAGKSLKERIQK
ncbi:MAG: DNA-binding protein HU-beta [Candidatus Krumholzibacteriia bacterium]|jgi:DNA-binding protein HU-beta